MTPDQLKNAELLRDIAGATEALTKAQKVVDQLTVGFSLSGMALRSQGYDVALVLNDTAYQALKKVILEYAISERDQHACALSSLLAGETLTPAA